MKINYLLENFDFQEDTKRLHDSKESKCNLKKLCIKIILLFYSLYLVARRYDFLSKCKGLRFEN